MSTAALPNIYLAFWNLDVKEPIRIETARDHLRAANLKPERAADVPPSTAMRRAAESVRDKGTEAKTFTAKDTGRTRTQFDTIAEDNGRIRRTFKSQYELNEEGHPRNIDGDFLPDFENAFDQARDHYTGGDLSKVIQAILAEDGLGAYSPRKNGGVYFVPVRPEAADLLQRIEQFCSAVSIRFLTYTVPDTAAQREEIADAVAQSYRDEIQTHAEAIAAYTVDTKPGTVSNRREAIQATYEHMARLRSLMNGRYDSCALLMDDLLMKIRNLEIERDSRAEQTAQEQRQQGQRRILTTGAV